MRSSTRCRHMLGMRYARRDCVFSLTKHRLDSRLRSLSRTSLNLVGYRRRISGSSRVCSTSTPPSGPPPTVCSGPYAKEGYVYF